MTTIYVDNIKCGGCANSIDKKLRSMENISGVSIDIEQGAIHFESDSGVEKVEEVKKALAKLGYPEKGTSDLIDNAKSYVSCMIGRLS